jgi:hypothetical protein
VEKDRENPKVSYNPKIKGNTHYHILLMEVSLSPIESMAMTRYLMPWKKIGFLRLLQNPIKTIWSSSEDDIKIPSIFKIIRVSRKMSLYTITIILKILLHLNLRRNHGVTKN